MVFEDFGVRARRKNECVPHGIIWQGWWPWQARNRCCRSSKHVKKLLAKARLTEIFKKCWVSYESARARGMKFWHFFWKTIGFLCVYVKIATKPKVLEGFRLARANVHFTLFFARDSWNLIMLEQEKVARARSCNINVEKPLVLWGSDSARGVKVWPLFWKTIGCLRFLG